MLGKVIGAPVGEEDHPTNVIKRIHDSDTDEGLGMTKKSKNKGRKHRRSKKTNYKPYYKMTEDERTKREEREKLRELQVRQRMLAKGRITAPYNTTQFLMSDKPDMDPKSHSFSEESYYSSHSENEEDFIVKEFKKDYEGEQVSRYERMTKEMLLDEFMKVERRNEILEARLDSIRLREEEREKNGEADYQWSKGEIPMEPEMAEKIRVFQNEIEKLRNENSRLIIENKELRDRLSDSSSSESSSDSSSDSSSESSDDVESVVDDEEIVMPPVKVTDEVTSTEDTGYESNQSKEDLLPDQIHK